MENYKIAKKLYSENKFETAIEYFKESFNNEVLNENEKIDCLTQIIKIQKLINKKEDSVKVEKDLAEFLIQRKEYSSAIEVLSKLLKKNESYETSLSLIDTLVLEGRLSSAEEKTIDLFKYLYRKKNYQKTLKLYQYAKEKFPPNLKFDSYYILGLINQGDTKTLSEIEIPDFNILFESLLGSPFNHWRHSEVYIENLIEGTLSSSDFNLNKLGIKLTLEAVLLKKNISESSLNRILRYFISKERKTASRLLCNLAEALELNLEEKLTYKIDSLPEDEEVDTEMDFGQDLLAEDQNGKDQADKIAENIELLRSMGEDEEANLLLLKLKRMHPDHELAVAGNDSGTRVRVKRLEVEDLERAWDESFSGDQKNQLELLNRAKATIANLSDQEVLSSYRDLIFCFNTMELYEASLKIFEKVLDLNKKSDLELDLEFNYLMVKTLIGNQDYFKAYDIVTQINGSTPLVGEKRIEFLYLQGEIARKLGRKKDAIKSYLLVRSINPNYRLVRQRLTSFG